ncbi:MAG: hypothetical protein LC777_05765 [Actinobacteria bacterium]|nr:hypothetical protein [Actinomycetota bacterium]
MSSDEASRGRSGSVLAGLLAPLRLPERVLEALDELRPMRSELTRVREQTKPLGDLLPALEHLEEVLAARLDAIHEVIVALESEESYLNRTSVELGAKVGALSDVLSPVDERLATLEATIGELAGEVGAIHETVRGLKDDIQRTTGLRGDRGIMERARDALTGGNEEEDRPNSQDSADAP